MRAGRVVFWNGVGSATSGRARRSTGMRALSPPALWLSRSLLARGLRCCPTRPIPRSRSRTARSTRSRGRDRRSTSAASSIRSGRAARRGQSGTTSPPLTRTGTSCHGTRAPTARWTPCSSRTGRCTRAGSSPKQEGRIAPASPQSPSHRLSAEPSPVQLLRGRLRRDLDPGRRRGRPRPGRRPQDRGPSLRRPHGGALRRRPDAPAPVPPRARPRTLVRRRKARTIRAPTPENHGIDAGRLLSCPRRLTRPRPPAGLGVARG